jgi:restriction system protein
MPRSRQKHLIEPKLLLGLLAAVVLIWIAVNILQALLNSSAVLIVLMILAAGALLITPKLLRSERRHRVLGKANTVIEQHMDELVRRRAQLVRRDAYGKLQLDRWTREIEYFITHHVSPLLTKEEQALLDRERVAIARIIAERTEKLMQEKPIFAVFSDDMTPTEFEIFCAEQLKRSGWDARVTLQSRDQGIDVVAEKAGLRVVLQCKLYSGPVGNKAVQEIAAGKAHAQAHRGAVVTNSRYTSSAEQLASSNGVLLLHYSDLANLGALLQ